MPEFLHADVTDVQCKLLVNTVHCKLVYQFYKVFMFYPFSNFG